MRGGHKGRWEGKRKGEGAKRVAKTKNSETSVAKMAGLYRKEKPQLGKRPSIMPGLESFG